MAREGDALPIRPAHRRHGARGVERDGQVEDRREAGAKGTASRVVGVVGPVDDEVVTDAGDLEVGEDVAQRAGGRVDVVHHRGRVGRQAGIADRLPDGCASRCHLEWWRGRAQDGERQALGDERVPRRRERVAAARLVDGTAPEAGRAGGVDRGGAAAQGPAGGAGAGGDGDGHRAAGRRHGVATGVDDDERRLPGEDLPGDAAARLGREPQLGRGADGDVERRARRRRQAGDGGRERVAGARQIDGAAGEEGAAADDGERIGRALERALTRTDREVDGDVGADDDVAAGVEDRDHGLDGPIGAARATSGRGRERELGRVPRRDVEARARIGRSGAADRREEPVAGAGPVDAAAAERRRPADRADGVAALAGQRGAWGAEAGCQRQRHGAGGDVAAGVAHDDGRLGRQHCATRAVARVGRELGRRRGAVRDVEPVALRRERAERRDERGDEHVGVGAGEVDRAAAELRRAGGGDDRVGVARQDRSGRARAGLDRQLDDALDAVAAGVGGGHRGLCGERGTAGTTAGVGGERHRARTAGRDVEGRTHRGGERWRRRRQGVVTASEIDRAAVERRQPRRCGDRVGRARDRSTWGTAAGRERQRHRRRARRDPVTCLVDDGHDRLGAERVSGGPAARLGVELQGGGRSGADVERRARAEDAVVDVDRVELVARTRPIDGAALEGGDAGDGQGGVVGVGAGDRRSARTGARLDDQPDLRGAGVDDGAVAVHDVGDRLAQPGLPGEPAAGLGAERHVRRPGHEEALAVRGDVTEGCPQEVAPALVDGTALERGDAVDRRHGELGARELARGLPGVDDQREGDGVGRVGDLDLRCDVERRTRVGVRRSGREGERRHRRRVRLRGDRRDGDRQHGRDQADAHPGTDPARDGRLRRTATPRRRMRRFATRLDQDSIRRSHRGLPLPRRRPSCGRGHDDRTERCSRLQVPAAITAPTAEARSGWVRDNSWHGARPAARLARCPPRSMRQTARAGPTVLLTFCVTGEVPGDESRATQNEDGPQHGARPEARRRSRRSVESADQRAEVGRCRRRTALRLHTLRSPSAALAAARRTYSSLSMAATCRSAARTRPSRLMN